MRSDGRPIRLRTGSNRVKAKRAIFDVHRKQMRAPAPAAPRRKIDFEERLIQMEKMF